MPKGAHHNPPIPLMQVGDRLGDEKIERGMPAAYLATTEDSCYGGRHGCKGDDTPRNQNHRHDMADVELPHSTVGEPTAQRVPLRLSCELKTRREVEPEAPA